MNIVVKPAKPADAETVAKLIGELLAEIMGATGSKEFNFNLIEAKASAEGYLRRNVYFAFIAWTDPGNEAVGVLSLYECHSLYAEGIFGTIAELFVRPAFRSQGIGQSLLKSARDFAATRDWKRIEVTTPPLPLFQRSLEFYAKQGFAITGGHKLKTLL